jgi:ANTAR domain-containing protein
VLRRFAKYHNLEGAFGRRAMIERAKGILMAIHGIDEQEAFEMLRSQSQHNGRKLVDLAEARRPQPPPAGYESALLASLETTATRHGSTPSFFREVGGRASLVRPRARSYYASRFFSRPTTGRSRGVEGYGEQNCSAAPNLL